LEIHTAMIKDHYKTLGVSRTATARDIMKARNQLLRKYHPDMNHDHSIDAKEMTIEVLQAAETLMDPESRAQYDRVYQNNFSIVTPRNTSRERAPRNATPHPQGVRVVVCPQCRNRNINPKYDYCMYCGAGIGEHPKPFSNDRLADDIAEFMNIAGKRQTPVILKYLYEMPLSAKCITAVFFLKLILLPVNYLYPSIDEYAQRTMIMMVVLVFVSIWLLRR
jgi:hypothetical protein